MSLYCDGVHLISDISIDDLHIQATRIGIKKCWYHSGTRHPHYDLPKRIRNKESFFQDFPFIKKVSPREIFEILTKAGLVK